MQSKFILVFIISLLYSSVYAQVELNGKVLDEVSGEPLIGASVIIEGTGEGTITDFDGFFTLETNVPIPLTLEVSYLGYDAKNIEVTDESEDLNIKLAESSVNIDVVEVKASRVSDETKKSPLTVEALDAIAIKETPSQDFYSGLGALKGVDLTTASLGFTVINTRGFNSTSPVRSLQIIDGVDNQSPGLNFSLGNFLGSSELDIQKAELIVGASSAFYGPNAFNGVLSMETKNPFFHQGLSAFAKVAERDFYHGAIRFADAFQTSEGDDWMSYKLNFSYMRAYDWEADNYDPIYDLEGDRVFENPENNPGGYNAVNIYGDEFFSSSSDLKSSNAGLNTFYRNGYSEKELVDYNTENIKAGVALHFRTNPSAKFDSPELIVSSSFGYGNTVYQGDNRFSLRGIQFYQQRLELTKKDKYFLRFYATHEDAGDSYDPYFTALRLQEFGNQNDAWEGNYREWWTRRSLGDVFNKMKEMGYPVTGTTEEVIEWQRQHQDQLSIWHDQASDYADSGLGTNAEGAKPVPGTMRFDSLFNAITAAKNNTEENGTLFYDKSALYHMHGEYQFDTDFFRDLRIGANARLYTPNSDGTIFDDEDEKITNFEYGIYTGGSKIIDDFTLSGAIRLDKNENYDFLLSPAASVVYNPEENTFMRFSFSSAIRNPTLSDQYLNLDVGPATLVGNINGFDSLILLDNFNEWRRNPNERLNYINIDPIQPEKVQTYEMGLRTLLFNSLFLDGSVYYNRYRDFIGYQIGATIDFIEIPPKPWETEPTYFLDLNSIQIYRVSANSEEIVNTVGAALGFNYYFADYYSISGNYSFNRLTTEVNDDIVPAYNTPEHKYNIGIGARNMPLLDKKVLFGFNLNYKWIDGFLFEGSPQFTGFIPTYDLLDAQINFAVPKINTTFKIGASNILDNRQFQTYGGPRIGRMAYISATYDFKKKN